MQFPAFKRILLSATRAAIARFREIRRERRARAALKDLSQHLLEDIGQASYYERRELDRGQRGNSADLFRS
jgi:uncharacterized protein YjiS (DUF1127 family)